MPNTNYSLQLVQDAANSIAVVVSRNSTTQLVDPATSASAPNRLSIQNAMGAYDSRPVSVISAATAATPIVATVAAGHLLNTGDWATVYSTLAAGAGDNNIIGTFLVTVAGNSVTLLGSATAGTYTANSASITELNKCVSFHIALAAAMCSILDDKASGF